MDHEEIVGWLREDDPQELTRLWKTADDLRHQNVGDEVHLRGLVEFSNHCARLCGYCGLRADNCSINRYRMSADEIVHCAHQAREFGYGTVVLQSGEDRGVTMDWLADLVRRIKAETGRAVTLSVGERDVAELAAWREAGADRYLMRFETSNPHLYSAIHPDLPGKISDRIVLLQRMRDLGYEVGSGVMVGIPGQNYDDLARDIALFRELDLDMIGIGPFLPHPATPLGQKDVARCADQVPNSEMMTYKAVALTRIACPLANIPSTTALATVNRAAGRELGLRRGANIVMPNITPVKYRKEYQIYPGKACLMEDAVECHTCMEMRIRGIGREIGRGTGRSRNHVQRYPGTEEETSCN